MQSASVLAFYKAEGMLIRVTFKKQTLRGILLEFFLVCESVTETANVIKILLNSFRQFRKDLTLVESHLHRYPPSC
jgi:hypothetical protein